MEPISHAFAAEVWRLSILNPQGEPLSPGFPAQHGIRSDPIELQGEVHFLAQETFHAVGFCDLYW